MKIAILHEMLVKFGGAEKVVESLLRIYPDADLFTLIYDEKKINKFFWLKKINKQVFKLKTQKIYNIFHKQRLCLPFMKNAVESLDFSKYDLLIASSSWFAHWAITKPETKFVVYYHSPARYMWDWTNEYKKDIGWNNWIKWYFLNKLFLNLRIWDFIASNRADISLANSINTKNRITKYYRKDSEILYPPVETKRFKSSVSWNISSKEKKKLQNYYIIISALTEFKKIEIAINWFNELNNMKLVIIWEWNSKENLKKLVKNSNIKFVWTKYGNELVSLVQNSNWLIFPWEEDFGIVPIEVMAAWKPVFAYRWWWLIETILEWITWEFFDKNDWQDFIKKFIKFDKKNNNLEYLSEKCKKQANKFCEKNFENRIKQLIK